MPVIKNVVAEACEGVFFGVLREEVFFFLAIDRGLYNFSSCHASGRLRDERDKHDTLDTLTGPRANQLILHIMPIL